MKYKNIIIILLIFIVVTFVSYYFLRSNTINNYPSEGRDIIAFGDSLVFGVGSTPGNDFVSKLSDKIGEPIINLGRSGDTTRDGLSRINELDNYNPKIVILLLGGNDYLKKLPVEETRKNLATIIENIESRGSIVLLLGVRGGLISDPFEKEFKDLENKYKTALVSDVLSGLIGNMKYMSDAVHPNDVGYEMIAERIYPVLSGLLK